MSWRLQIKKRDFFNISFVQNKLFQHLPFISVYSVFNSLSEYIYFDISKNITSYTFLVFKMLESLWCITKSNLSDHKQFVSINSHDSCLASILHGISPGLVLGSLLLLIYINALNQPIIFC